MQLINFRDEKVPSWSWMAYSGKIQYRMNPGWHQSAGTTLNSDLRLDAQRRQILAPMMRIAQGCDVVQGEALRSNDDLVGWIRFDQDCKVVIGQGTTGWKDYAGISWAEKFPTGKFYYVLLVTPTFPD
jgi:hypothetical protein